MSRRLDAYLQAWPGFSWAQRHCVHFALAYAAPHLLPVLAALPQPTGPLGVRAALRAAGTPTLAGALSLYLEPVPPLLAQPGDVVQVRRTLGLCAGRLAWLPMAEGRALAAWPMLHVARAWRQARGAA